MAAIYKAGRIGGAAVYSDGSGTAPILLAASATASGTATAALTTAIVLAAAAVASGIATADLQTGAPVMTMAASATASGIATASLTTSIVLAASAVATGVATASLITGTEPAEDVATSPQYTLKGTARRLVMTMATISNPGFSDKDPWERLPLGFDFSRDLAEIGSTLSESPAPVVTITYHSGTPDASPAEVKDGAPWISGAIVKQWVDDGVVGARYLVRCEAYAANGARLVMSGTMMVRTK